MWQTIKKIGAYFGYLALVLVFWWKDTFFSSLSVKGKIMALFSLVEKIDGGEFLYPEEEILDALIAIMERRRIDLDEEDELLNTRIEQLEDLRDEWEEQCQQAMQDLMEEFPDIEDDLFDDDYASDF